MNKKWWIILLLFLLLIFIIAILQKKIINIDNNEESHETGEIFFDYHGPNAHAEYDVSLNHGFAVNKLNVSRNFTILSVVNLPGNVTKIKFNYNDSSIPVEKQLCFSNYLTIFGDDYIWVDVIYYTSHPVSRGIYSLEDEEFWQNVTKQYTKDRDQLKQYFYHMLEEIERMMGLPKVKSYDVRFSELKL